MHALQELVAVVATGRLGVAVVVAIRLEAAGGLDAVVVVFVVIFVIGHVNVDVATLEGAKHPISHFLVLLFFLCDLLELILLCLVVVGLLQNLVRALETGVKGLTSPLCSSIDTSIFFGVKGRVALACSKGCR